MFLTSNYQQIAKFFWREDLARKKNSHIELPVECLGELTNKF